MLSDTSVPNRTDQPENIQVYLRVRPLRPSEPKEGACVKPGSEGVFSILIGTTQKNESFIFDRIFWPEAEQVGLFYI